MQPQLPLTVRLITRSATCKCILMFRLMFVLLHGYQSIQKTEFGPGLSAPLAVTVWSAIYLTRKETAKRPQNDTQK